MDDCCADHGGCLRSVQQRELKVVMGSIVWKRSMAFPSHVRNVSPLRWKKTLMGNIREVLGVIYSHSYVHSLVDDG